MNRRRILDATRHCVHCPTLCLDACPVSTVEATDVVSPWAKMLTANQFASERITVSQEAVDALYFCSDCGACESACKHTVDVSETLQQIRAQAVEDGIISVPVDAISVPVESPDQASLPVGCSGARLRAAGYVLAFQKAAQSAARRWETRATLSFQSAEDARCVLKQYRALGLSVSSDIRLYTQDAALPDVDQATAYYEPPTVRECDGIDPDRIRNRVQEALNEHWVPWRGAGSASVCAGAAGTFPLISPTGAGEAARRVLRMAKAQGARNILTACIAYREHLKTYSHEFGLTVLPWGD